MPLCTSDATTLGFACALCAWPWPLFRCSSPVAAAVAATTTADPPSTPPVVRPDRRRGARGRAAARLPGLRDQEHDARRRRRRDRRRRRGRARHVSRAHARVAPGRGDPGRGARLAHRASPRPCSSASRSARRSCSPTATRSRTRRRPRWTRCSRPAPRRRAARRSSAWGRRRRSRATRRPTSSGANPAALAAAVDRAARGRGRAARRALVVVASLDRPEYAMPAAGWAAKSGDPLLWVTATGVPPETEAAIKTHKARQDLRARARGRGAGDRARRAGEARHGQARSPPPTPSPPRSPSPASPTRRRSAGTSSIPGHGLVFASTRAARRTPRPPRRCRRTGTYGPLLLLARRRRAARSRCRTSCSTSSPATTTDPVRGVYNHGWIIGDESAIAAAVQARIDTLLEIQPVDTGAQ